MRALVTGWRGYVGGHLAGRLRKDGWEVDLFEGDVSMSPIFRYGKPDVIFHLAAITRNAPSLADPTRCMKTNVMGSVRVFEEASWYDIRVVYASSNVVLSSIFTPYRISKKAVEDYAVFLNEKKEHDIYILRFGDVYGPGMRSGLFFTWWQQWKQYGTVELWGGHQTRDYVHVSDVVDALMLAAKAEGRAPWPMDICTGRQTSFTTIARMLGVPTRLMESYQGVAERLMQHVGSARDMMGFEAKVMIEEGIEVIRKEWELC